MSDTTEPPRCTAKTSSGRPCKQRPIKGGRVCVTHGGRAPQVRMKAAERVLEARIAGEVQRQGIEPIGDPYELLLAVAGEAVAFLALARQNLGVLTSWSQVDAMGAEGVRVAVTVYESALDRVIDTAAKIIKLNAVDKQVEIQARAVEVRSAEVLDFIGATFSHAVRVADLDSEMAARLFAAIPQAMEAARLEARP